MPRRSLLLTVVLLALAPAGAAAAEPWGSPRTLATAPAAGSVGGPAAAIDERGYALALWVRSDGRRASVLAARRTARRFFGDPFVLRSRARGVEAPVVEFDGERTAFAAYRRYVAPNYRVEGRAILSDGARTAPQLLGDGDASSFFPFFVDGPFSRPLLAWAHGPSPRFALRTAEAQEAGYAAAVDPGLPAHIELDLAAEPGGGLLAVFVPAPGPDTPRTPRVMAARRAPGATAFSAPVALSDGRRYPREPMVDVTEDGRAVTAWSESDGEAEHVVVAERKAGDERFGAVRELEQASSVSDIAVRATGDGDVLALWIASGRGATYAPLNGELRVAEVGGNGGAARTLSRPGQRVERYALDADGRGAVAVAWVGDVRREPGGPVDAVAITPSERIGRVQRLTRRGERATGLALAVGRRGDALAVWALDGGRLLRTARRPAGG